MLVGRLAQYSGLGQRDEPSREYRPGDVQVSEEVAEPAHPVEGVAHLARLAVASVPVDRSAMGSGANNTARNIGSALGVALVVSVATRAGHGATRAQAFASGANSAALLSAALCLTGTVAVLLLDPARWPISSRSRSGAGAVRRKRQDGQPFRAPAHLHHGGAVPAGREIHDLDGARTRNAARTSVQQAEGLDS